MYAKDLMEWLVVDAVRSSFHLPLALEGWQVEESSSWWMGRWSRVNMMRKGLTPRLPSLFQFSLEGADHQEEVEPKSPAASATDDVHRGWAAGDAEQDVEDVEEEADSSHDDPGHHEAGIPLKYK